MVATSVACVTRITGTTRVAGVPTSVTGVSTRVAAIARTIRFVRNAKTELAVGIGRTQLNPATPIMRFKLIGDQAVDHVLIIIGPTVLHGIKLEGGLLVGKVRRYTILSTPAIIRIDILPDLARFDEIVIGVRRSIELSSVGITNQVLPIPVFVHRLHDAGR